MQRIPVHHPLGPIREMVDEVLDRLWLPFDKLHSKVRRPPIPPGRQLRALWLEVLYTIRSLRPDGRERMLMERRA